VQSWGSSLLPQDRKGFCYRIHDRHALVQFDDHENLVDGRDRPDQHETLAQLFRPLMAVFQYVNALHVQVLEFAAIHNDGASSTDESHEHRLQGRGG